MMSDSDYVRFALNRALDSAAAQGMPRIQLRGQLIRPCLAYAAASTGDNDVPPEFWSGALAIQLAHEASLVHDDIVDQSSVRRGEPTLVQSHGVAKALVYGDHLLTAAYRLASETRSIEFVTLFSRCVERTVAGEIAQAKSLGTTLSFSEYRQIARSKSGELLAASLALGAVFSNPARIHARAELGRELGLLYQMLDDLLDYCPSTDMGKPAYGDFKQKRWTWPLLEIDDFTFDMSCEEMADRFCRESSERSPLARCLERIELEAAGLTERLVAEFGNADAGLSLIEEWVARAGNAVALEQKRPDVLLKAHLPVNEDAVRYLAKNSKSFRFASRFFPKRELATVANIYAFCRVTDDLVDNNPTSDAEYLLDQWMMLARRAYDGSMSGISFIDRAMNEMRSGDVPFKYAAELAEGMRMDLRRERYETLTDLRRYTYRVASTVGLWITELAGVRDETVLAHAESLGHAMQLTNILRDVGEDARMGRLYLPADRLQHHGVSEQEIMLAANGASPIPCGFAALIDEMLRCADRDYEFALAGVQYLPPAFRGPVTVAAHVYRGIHSEIRRNRYDTLTCRAVTSATSKAGYAARALWTLRAGDADLKRRPGSPAARAAQAASEIPASRDSTHRQELHQGFLPA